MTIRTFWTILIKVLGIWLVLDSVEVVSQFLSTLFYLRSSGSAQDIGLIAALSLFIMGIYILVMRIFVFKTIWIIDKLHLDKGFDEEKIDLNVQLSTVLTVATISIGALIFIDSFPQLCKQIFAFFQLKNMFTDRPTSGWIIFHFVKTMLGYLLMTNSKQVVAYINKQ